jgi:hypothetical protein
MKKIKYILFVVSLVAAVGVSYATITLKGMPDTFEMEDDDE